MELDIGKHRRSTAQLTPLIREARGHSAAEEFAKIAKKANSDKHRSWLPRGQLLVDNTPTAAAIEEQPRIQSTIRSWADETEKEENIAGQLLVKKGTLHAIIEQLLIYIKGAALAPVAQSDNLDLDSTGAPSPTPPSL